MSSSLAVAMADRGRSNDPLVILVHGTLDRKASFGRTVRRVDTHDVATFDRRGYADSLDLGASADFSRHVADVLSVADGRRCVVIGHSFGGLLALGAGFAAPEQVRAVGVYEAPAPWLYPSDAPAGWAERDNPERAVEAFFRAVVGDRSWERLPDGFRSARLAEGPAMVADLTMAQQGLPFDLGDILQPVCFAHGNAGQDRFRGSAHALADGVRDSSVHHLEGSSHGAHLSHADAFSAWVRTVTTLAI